MPSEQLRLFGRKDRWDILRAPTSEAFSAMAATVGHVTFRRVIPNRDNPDLYRAPIGEVHVPHNDVEALLHELAHWVMAGPQRRDQYDYGLDESKPSAWHQELLCGWLQADICARAEIQRPKSSVDSVRFEDSPQWRPVALSRFSRYVGWADRLAVVEALRLPGGDVGLWAG